MQGFGVRMSKRVSCSGSGYYRVSKKVSGIKNLFMTLEPPNSAPMNLRRRKRKKTVQDVECSGSGFGCQNGSRVRVPGLDFGY